MTASKQRLISIGLAVATWPFFWRPSRGWARHLVAGMLAAAIVAIVAVQFDLFAPAQKMERLNDNHAKLSLRQALVLTTCGKYGQVEHADDSWLPAAGIPYRKAIDDRFGSPGAYCASTARFVNNENALFWVMSALLSLPPDDTPETLAAKMVTFRCSMLFTLLYFLALIGVGPAPLTAAGFAVGRGIEVVQQTHILSVYPTLNMLLLVAGALLALLTAGLGRKCWPALVAGGIAFGLAWGLISNFRTSYGMMVATQLAAALTAYAVWNRPFRLAKCCGFLVSAMAGLLAVQAAVAHLHPSTGYNYSHHPIWHPIVLGLANPGSALARREGLRFDDALGEVLAKRIDPTVSELGPGYEKALRDYYLKLWSNHPDEMTDIYISKVDHFQLVLSGHMESFFSWLSPQMIFSEWIVTGWTWFAVLIVAFLAASAAYPLNAPVSIFGRTLGVALLGLTVEQIFVVATTIARSHQTTLIVGAAVLSATLIALAGALLRRLGPAD